MDHDDHDVYYVVDNTNDPPQTMEEQMYMLVGLLIILAIAGASCFLLTLLVN